MEKIYKDEHGKIIVKTDNKWHEILYINEIPKNIIDEEDIDDEQDFDDKDYGWVKDGKDYFHLSQFLRMKDFGIPILKNDWDGILNYGYGSGMVIKISDSGDGYKIGYFYTED